MSKMTEAIAGHRAAWQAFQVAPDGPEGSAEYRAALRAETAEHDAIDVLLSTRADSIADVVTLKEHLDWYVTEEAQRSEITPEMFALHDNIELAMIWAAGRALEAIKGEAPPEMELSQ